MELFHRNIVPEKHCLASVSQKAHELNSIRIYTPFTDTAINIAKKTYNDRNEYQKKYNKY